MMKRILLICAIMGIVVTACNPRNPITLCVLETTDLHGTMGPEMSALSGYIHQTRKTYGNRLLLFDNGDNIQGSAEVFYANYIDTTHIHAVTDMFNWLDYTAIAVGNHDIEEGPLGYGRFYKDMKAPVLCANMVHKKTGRPIFKPYVTFRREGYKIAVLGLVSSEALDWLPESLHPKSVFIPVNDCVESWVDKIYKKDNPDVLITLFHGGCQGDEVESAFWIAKNVAGIHLLCCGHTHQTNAFGLLNPAGDTTYIIEPGAYASHIGKALLTLTPDGRKKPKIAVSTELIAAKDLPPDDSFQAKMSPFFQAKDAFFNKPIASIDTTVYSRDALYEPGVWTDLLHRAFLDIALSSGIYDNNSTITITSPASRTGVLQRGPLTLSDFIALYPYENTLSIVEMDGNEIKQYLEYSHALSIDNPDAPCYTFDRASGFRYVVHRDRPYGQRIEILSMSDGRTVSLRRRYHVAMTTFRALGGGGHLEKALSWDKQKMKARTIFVTNLGVRQMMMDYYANKSLDTTPLNDCIVVSD